MRSLLFAGAVLLSLALVSPAFAAVTFAVPNSVKIIAVNGKETKSKDHQAQMPNGINQVVFRVDTELKGKTLIDADRVQSDVLIMRFTAEETTLTLGIPEIRRERDLEEFNKNPEMTLTDKDGNAVVFAWDRLIKEGFQLMRDYEDELEEYNESKASAAVSLSELGVARAGKKVSRSVGAWNTGSETVEKSGDQAMTERMLKYWYQQADDDTRKRFWEWISE